MHENIRKSYAFLAEYVTNIEKIVFNLFQLKILTKNEADQIKMPGTTQDRNVRLLDIVVKKDRDEDVLRALLVILRKTDNARCADKIEGIDKFKPEEDELWRQRKSQHFAKALLPHRLDLSTFQNEGIIQKLWHVPPRNPNFIGRGELLEHVGGSLNEKGRPTIITACHGLGGVGKTQVALEFVWRYKENYSGVLWFNAENKESLKGDYIQLGNIRHLFRINENLNNKDKVDIVKHWLENPAQEGWLLVYDNVSKSGGEEGVQRYIPVTGGKVLITSRYATGWIQSFTVDVFTREESKTFLEKILFDKITEDEKDYLAERLGDLPLALAQAAAYMKKTRMKVPRYLQLYETKKKNLLEDKTLSESEGTLPADSNKASVYITWDITMAQIHKESTLAENWINVCAYLSPTNIPDYILENFSNHSENNPHEEIYDAARGILSNYSMITINPDDNSSSIHRVLQEVIQDKRKEERLATILKTGKTLNGSFPHGEYSMSSHERRRQLIPHFEICLEHLNVCDETLVLMSDASQKDEVVIDCLSSLSNAYLHLGIAEKAVDTLSREMTIQEKYYGPDHVSIAVILTNLGNAYGDLGEAKKKRDLLERALAIEEKYYKPDDVEVALTLGNLGNAYGALGEATKRRDLLERALPIIEKYYGPDHVNASVALVNLGTTYGSLGEATKKRDLLERALTIEEKYYGSEHVEVAFTLTNLGNAYGDLGVPTKKRNLLERALAIIEKYYGPEHVNVAVTLTSLGNAYADLGEATKSCDLLERSLAIQEKYYGPDHVEVALTLTSLGNAYGTLGEATKQRNLQERALAIEEKYYGLDHVGVTLTLGNLGNAYGALGEATKQRDLQERALAIQEKYYGPDHVEVAVTSTNLGNAYGALGEATKQRDFLERALVIQEKYFGPDHVIVAVTLANLGITYGALGEATKKRDLLERALTIEEKYYGSEHVEVAFTLTNLGNTYGDLEDSTKKRDLLQRALKIIEKYYGPDHVEVALTLVSLGNAYGDLGEVAKKRDFLERALAIEEKYYGPDHVEVAVTLASLGNVYGVLGDGDKHRSFLETALPILTKFYGPQHNSVVVAQRSLSRAYTMHLA